MKVLLKELLVILRALRKSPSYTIVVVLTLALGIGANAVVFGVLNALILRPLNLPHAESLYAIWRTNPGTAAESYPDYLDLRDRNHSFDGLEAFSVAPAGLDTGENSSRAWAYETSGNYFDGLEIQPYLGRFFHASDEHGANSAPYIVLSYAYWHTRFQDDRGVVGRTVQVNKHPFTIIGVSPPEFHGTLVFFSPDFFVPMVNQEQLEGMNNLSTRLNHGEVFMVMGHLKPGVTLAEAAGDLSSIGSYLENAYPKEETKMRFTLAQPGLYGDMLGRPVRYFLTGLLLLAGLFLLAACANLGSLLTARTADRSSEVALRLALGSRRIRILRTLFTEAVLVSLIGGSVGLLAAIAVLRGLSAWQPFPRFPIHMSANPDANVYAVALLLTVISGFLYGAVPVRQILRTDPYQVVKARSSGAVGRKFAARDIWLVVQIAICAVLVTSSMVAVRGLMRAMHSNFGFEPQNVMVADTDLNMAGYSGDKIPVMQRRMIDSMEAIPGVWSVGLVDTPPLTEGRAHSVVVFTDRTTDLRPANAAAHPCLYVISPGYLLAARTALLAGRTITWHDDQNAPRVAVVNQEFARRVFGSVTNAMSGYYKTAEGTRVQVVGIVEDGKYLNITEDQKPAMFVPFLQSPTSDTYLLIRSERDPLQVATAMRNSLRELDPGLPVSIQSWNQSLVFALFGARVATISLGVLGVMGATLALTGIYGMAAYSVSRRLREFGIRVALGAQPKQVLQAAMGRAFRLLTFGSVAGLLLGILATRVLAFIVYSATPRDPLVLAGVVTAMSLLGLLATWIPAQRALSVDPSIMLREE